MTSAAIDQVLNEEALQSTPTPRMNLLSDQPSTSAVVARPRPTTTTPDELRAFPKAIPLKPNRNRKKGKSLLLTSMPVKQQLEENAIRKSKLPKKSQKKKQTPSPDSNSESDEELYHWILHTVRMLHLSNMRIRNP